MFNIMGSYSLCWFLLVICLDQVTPQPIMNLSDFVSDPNNVINNSLCSNGLENDKDFFTVRGKVNKNGSNSTAYTGTNLYLQAVADASTNAWASQCRPDLTVCSSDLTTDCYCERKDANGDYHLVMTIMAKSIYSGGKLMLSWNDARSPYNQPITSNQVNYYPGSISDNETALIVTLTIGSAEKILNVYTNKNFTFVIEPNTKAATLCVYNLRPTFVIKIEDVENDMEQTNNGSCVTLTFADESPSRVLTTYIRESGGCERTVSFTINLGPGLKEEPPSGLDAREIGIVVGCLTACCVLIILVCLCYNDCCKGGATKSRDDDKESLEKCESSSDSTSGQTCKCSIFTKMNDCFLMKMKGCKAAPEVTEVTMEKGEIKEQNGNQGRHRLDTGMAEKTATTRKLPPIDNVSRSNHWRKSESTNDILDVNANRKKKKKKKKKTMKRTEAANEGATDHEKIKAQNGSQRKQNIDPMMTRDNTSPRPLPTPRNKFLSSSYEKEMTEKKTEGKETGNKGAINNEKVKAQDGSIGDRRGDTVVVEENASPGLLGHLPPIRNTYLVSNDGLESTISNDKSVAELKKKKKKKRKGTEVANEGAVDKEQIIAQDGSHMREKRPVPLPRTRSSPLIINKRRMSATSTN